jgi:HEAT repeat protein
MQTEREETMETPIEKGRPGTAYAFETNTEMMKAMRDVPRLIETLLNSEDPLARSRAAEILGDLRNGLAIEALIAALTDQFSAVRENAARSLVVFGDDAVDPLLHALKDQNTMKRTYAAGILGQIKSEKSVDALVSALTDEDPDVRCYAGGSLSQMGEPAVDPLIRSLKEQNPEVRTLAAATLARMGDRRAVDPLLQALRDSDASVRNAAAGGLVALGSDSVLPLMKITRDENQSVRFYAISILGILGDRRAEEVLREAKRDPDPDVQAAAVEALRRMQGRQDEST